MTHVVVMIFGAYSRRAKADVHPSQHSVEDMFKFTKE
jgi:hypothetical protein